MITLPKPKFSETNVPIGKSKEDYKDEIINKQTHVLNDAIDRVSFWEIISDPNHKYEHDSFAPIRIFLHLSGAKNMYI